MAEEKSNIRMPFSMCKAFLTETGKRANPEAVKRFEVMLLKAGQSIAATVAARTTSVGRATIYPEDFDVKEEAKTEA